MKTALTALTLIALSLSGCCVPHSRPCHVQPMRPPCGVGLPACVPTRFAEPHVPLYSTRGQLQLMPHSQFKIWDTTSPLE